MALIPFRANTQSSFFPLLSRQASQTVVASEVDQTFVPNVNPQDSVGPVERGIPQIMYGHNIMPSTYGYQSVGYIKLYDGVSEDINIDEIRLVISRDKVRTYFAFDYTKSRTVYVLSANGSWVRPGNAPAGTLDPYRKVTIANINGESIILLPGIGAYYYDNNAGTMYWQQLHGLQVESISGLLAANGYLIAWTRTGYAWSAVNDPYDFEPSDITGAGGGDLQDVQGFITHCQSTSYGFIVYTTNNAVGIMYSGNQEYPFNSRPLAAAGGLKNSDFVCVESSGSQYAYTTNGIQQIDHSGAKTILPAITDFLAGQIVEDFNDDTKEFVVNEFNTPMRKKFALVCDRYFVCSYGANQWGEMTHAIVVDLVQARIGKLRINHNTCFEHRNTDPEQDDTPRRSIAFADSKGNTHIVDFNTSNVNSKGTILYGKYQVTRGQFTNLQRVEVENVSRDRCEITLLTSFDGKNFKNKKVPVIDGRNSEGLISAYHCSIEAKSVSLLFQGQFEINGLVLFFQLGGDN